MEISIIIQIIYIVLISNKSSNYTIYTLKEYI